MSNKSVDNTLDKIKEVLEFVEESLSEWTGNGNLQFPVLIQMVAVKANWDEKQLRLNDALVRYHVRHHDDWYVTRGAHGGIMRKTDKQKKDAEKLAKETAKNQVKAALAAKVADKPPIDLSSIASAPDVDDDDDDE